MKKLVGVIVLVVALAIPVGAQNLDFLINLLKVVVEEYGIETVISVLEDLGYVGEGEVTANENVSVQASVNPDELTIRSSIWDDPEGEETLVYMVVSDDASCYSYIRWGRDQGDSLAERMAWRQYFVDECIGH